MAGRNEDDSAGAHESEEVGSPTDMPEHSRVRSQDLVRAAELASRVMDTDFSAQVHAIQAASSAGFGFSEHVRRALEAANQIDAGFSPHVRAVAEASARAFRDIGGPANELLAAMQRDHRALQESLASISGLTEQPWVKELEKTRRMLSSLDPAPWAASLQSGLDISERLGLQEVMQAQAEATSRLAEIAPSVVSALLEYEELYGDEDVLETDFDLLDAAVRAMPAVARPRLSVEPELPDQASPPVRVGLVMDPGFNPMESGEILVWVRAHGVPMTCACLGRMSPGEALSINVSRVLLALDFAEQEGLGLPTVVFDCGQCGRRVLHGVWDELRRAGGGLDVLEGGLSADEWSTNGERPELNIVPSAD